MLSILLTAMMCTTPSFINGAFFQDRCLPPREFKISVDVNMTGNDCAMRVAPIELARWSEEHPKFRILKWKCLPSAMVAKSI